MIDPIQTVATADPANASPSNIDAVSAIEAQEFARALDAAYPSDSGASRVSDGPNKRG